MIAINKYKFNIMGNFFDENFSGNKGTALYLKQISSIRISDNTFSNNGPVYAMAEQLFSPYTKFLSLRTMTFYDDNCYDEFQYLQDCQGSEDVSMYGGIQFANVQGVIYVNFCEEDYCFNMNST